MNLQVTQENLQKSLGSVARVASSRNALPILANVLLQTKNNRLCVTATNLDIAITHYVGAKIKTEGSITVPARLTQDFINSLPSDVINLELKEHRLSIISGKYQSTINGIIADDFPAMPAIADPKTFVLPAKDLRKGLQQVVFAASSDETRQILTAVYFYSFEGNLYLAATDSYRLAERKLSKCSEDVSLLIPAQSMSDLLRILNDSTDDVVVEYDEQLVRFVAGDIELVTRMINGKYPDYRKLIPEKFAVTATLERDQAVNITKVSSLFARENAGSVVLKADDDKKEVSIASVASQLGENTSEASAEVAGSGDVTLNSRYVLDGLQAFGSKKVTLNFNGKLEPFVIKSPEEPEYTHVVMPLRS